MPKSPTTADILKRVELLESSLKEKDAEISNLKSALQETEKFVADELQKRDIIITDLQCKIDELSSKDVQDAASDPVSSELPISSEFESSVKNEHDLLIIGDSLVRGLDTEALNPGGDSTVACLPGARPDDLVEKFREMSKTNSYRRIIFHAGTNLIPKYSPTFVADKITSSLEMIRSLSPSSKLAFSALLPKEGPHLLAGINMVNYRVFRSGLTGHKNTRYGFVHHREYMQNKFGIIDGSLFAKDNVHLSKKGTDAFTRSLSRLVKTE